MDELNGYEAANSKAIVEAGPSEETVEGWHAKYGYVYKVPCDDEETPFTVYCRKPSRQHLSRFMKTANQKGDALQAAQNLFADTLLYPDMDKLKPIFDERPGLILSLAVALQELIGLNVNFTPIRLYPLRRP